ncbi:CpsD/CapB family tyrosine-protein kinase [Jiella pacifica]|uniref:Chromosome partitioning ATPase, Mrp family, contains Fe-S cluster n=1 Tax=Jiella pacifica TaxID=2696469 RepID=A0A6N9T4I4_9HYPH|nr:CpsD/CapB family tyrosine-protein kinase [Jiella pacifica]NDW06287.1 hypothetical protein [Jiella pacifica]
MTIEQSRDTRYDFEAPQAASVHNPDLANRQRSSKTGTLAQAPGEGDGDAEQVATASELATAIQATDIVRIVVLSTHRELGSFGGLELARRLSGAGRGTVLIDLTPEGSVGGRMSLPPDALGYADLLSGGAGLADIIYRDHYTSTHFVPTGGFEMETAEEADLAHLGHVLDAFAEAYDYTVVEADPLDIPELPALLDETTAVVIAGLPHVDDRMIDVADDLRMIGIEDIVFMPMVRRTTAE